MKHHPGETYFITIGFVPFVSFIKRKLPKVTQSFRKSSFIQCTVKFDFRLTLISVNLTVSP